MKHIVVCIYYCVVINMFIVGSTFVLVYAMEADGEVEV